MRYYDEISAYLDACYPVSLSESWDNDGAMVYTSRPITKVLIALDCSTPAIKQAYLSGCELIVTHHPLLFKKPYSLEVFRRLVLLKKLGIGLLSYHTRLDEVEGGVNDCFASALGLKCAMFMEPCARMTVLPEPITFQAMYERASALCQGYKPFAVKCSDTCRRIATVSGGGKSFIQSAAVKHGCDTLITGEASHDAYIASHELGLNLICVGHHNSESVVLPALAANIKSRFNDVTTYIFDFTETLEYGI